MEHASLLEYQLVLVATTYWSNEILSMQVEHTFNELTETNLMPVKHQLVSTTIIPIDERNS